MLSRLFHRESRTGPFDLARPLLHWSPRDPWTIGMACEGTLICGASGAGKTSGSGKTIAMSMLQNFGGLILTAKAEEIPLWQRYCEAAGRLDDLVLFGPGQPYRFNFLNHELHRSGPGAGYTENVVNVFTTIMELAQHRPTGGGRDSEAYWLLAMRQLIRNAVDLLILAVGWVSIPDLYRLIVSAPPSLAAVASEDWRRGSFCYRHLMLAEKRDKTPGQRQDFELAADYFLQEFPALSDKTRSVIVSTFTSSIDMLNRGVLRELFCTDTNITPEAVQGGRLILMGLPVKEFGAIGLIAQTIWKYMFQRSIEQRDVSVSPRPVFLWADEAQNFITAYDAQFQTTCRSARVATVYLTQNISNVYAALGGESKGKAEADSLFGNFNTKIFHQNTDSVTNDWAAALIGRNLQTLCSGNSSRQTDEWTSFTGFGAEQQSSAGYSEVYEYEVQPSEFTRLRTGGPRNGGLVDAIIVQGGRRFRGNGRIWTPVTFRQ